MIPCAASPSVSLAFMSFGFSEILLVGVVALLVFGGDLPDVMRSLGRSYAKLRGSLHELSRPVRKELQVLKDIPPPARHVPGGLIARATTPEPPAADETPVEEYPEYPSPPAAEQATTPEEPETKATGVADEPPPV